MRKPILFVVGLAAVACLLFGYSELERGVSLKGGLTVGYLAFVAGIVFATAALWNLFREN